MWHLPYFDLHMAIHAAWLKQDAWQSWRKLKHADVAYQTLIGIRLLVLVSGPKDQGQGQLLGGHSCCACKSKCHIMVNNNELIEVSGVNKT